MIIELILEDDECESGNVVSFADYAAHREMNSEVRFSIENAQIVRLSCDVIDLNAHRQWR